MKEATAAPLTFPQAPAAPLVGAAGECEAPAPGDTDTLTGRSPLLYTNPKEMVR